MLTLQNPFLVKLCNKLQEAKKLPAFFAQEDGEYGFSSKSSVVIKGTVSKWVRKSLEKTEFYIFLLISALIYKTKAVEKPVEIVNNLS